MNDIGIRREDKNRWERRAPLTPGQVGQLVKQGIEVVVQPSAIRAFADDEYARAGARLADDLSACRLVLAVKEIPVRRLAAGQAYAYFAHVIKGQPYNMPMLARLLELGCSLIDYEKITDDRGRRLVFFGRHAGLAGMADSLWTLGRRLAAEGLDTAFAELQPAHHYPDLAALKRAVAAAGRRLAEEGLPEELVPLVFGFAGYGNVSQGAQEIFDLLPHRQITPAELLGRLPAERNLLFKVVFQEKDMVEPARADGQFVLQDYYQHPENYRGVFSRYLPRLTVLMNCIYWTERYPRLLTRQDLRRLWAAGATPALRIIGDVSCDVEGAVECTLKCTSPDDPVYVYRVDADDVVSGVEGRGPVVLAVDNLPCELPAESTEDFGRALLPFLPAMARADYSRAFTELELPEPIRRAVITHRGRLTPDFAYLQQPLELHGGGQ
ncbi:MAG: hypothetical protein DRI34_02790 [Deltaproteobacteria bacterium]|nr:MAG: hypothetical protein DRI34_02790 [Deltaproteobacteria bacterium]